MIAKRQAALKTLQRYSGESMGFQNFFPKGVATNSRPTKDQITVEPCDWNILEEFEDKKSDTYQQHYGPKHWGPPYLPSHANATGV